MVPVPTDLPFQMFQSLVVLVRVIASLHLFSSLQLLPSFTSCRGGHLFVLVFSDVGVSLNCCFTFHHNFGQLAFISNPNSAEISAVLLSSVCRSSSVVASTAALSVYLKLLIVLHPSLMPELALNHDHLSVDVKKVWRKDAALSDSFTLQNDSVLPDVVWRLEDA